MEAGGELEVEVEAKGWGCGLARVAVWLAACRYAEGGGDT